MSVNAVFIASLIREPAAGPARPRCRLVIGLAGRGLRVLGAAAYHTLLPPLAVDFLGPRAGLEHRVLRGERTGGRLREHVRDDVRVEDLALRGIRKARVA